MMYTGAESQRAELIHTERSRTPSSAPVQTIASISVARASDSSSRANGVYDPAMIRKMFAWSMRFSTSVVRGPQFPRW